MDKTPLVLTVDDEEGILRSIERILLQQGYRVAAFGNPRDALQSIRAEAPDLMVVDLHLPEMDGIQLMQAARTIGQDTEFVFVSGTGTIESAVEAIKQGAYDFIEKPFDRTDLVKVVRKALERHRLLRENRELRDRLEQLSDGDHAFSSQNRKMRDVLDLVRQVAPTTATVLVLGESGTGKERAAETIHRLSGRRHKPFVKVNCAALPETLLESELFGYEKGAFTDARESRAGRFEMASGGTILLDEIGETSPAMQVKLLRVLQEHEIERLGGGRTIPVDIRVIASTNADLESLVKAGKFRQDLYFRLNVICVSLPPLRERTEDIPFMARAFLNDYAAKNGRPGMTLSNEAMELLLRYPWPGNIRELQNVVERAVIVAREDCILPRDLPKGLLDLAEDDRPAARKGPDAPLGVDRSDLALPFGLSLEEAERRYARETLRRLGGNKPLAANLLGVNLRTLYRRL